MATHKKSADPKARAVKPKKLCMYGFETVLREGVSGIYSGIVIRISTRRFI
jgi:hypothetical protein